MWKGAVSFGLVTIPVSLEPAVRQQDIHFHQFHDTDGGRIREKRVCEKDGKEVSYDHIVKGYEISKEKYVMVTRDELKTLDPVADKLISIEAFVPLVDIDPVYFERTYHVLPDGKAADKAYALFTKALDDSGQVALGRIVLSTQQHMAILRVSDGVMLLTTMVYGDEVTETPKVPKTPVSAKELQMANQLIEQMKSGFEPKKYRDDHRERVIAMLKKKAAGKEYEAPQTPEPEKFTDLTDALERSLAAQKKPAGRAKAPKRARPRTAARTRRSHA